MKRIKVMGMLLIMFLLCGCASKYQGTWCRYSDVATSLIILNDDISDDNISLIQDYIKTIEDLKSYDLIPIIEDSSRMITVYYQKEDNLATYEEKLKTLEGVKQVKSTRVNAPVDKLVVKGNNNYVYDVSLNNLSALEYSGKYEINGNELKLDNDIVFYYKNKFLCYDKDCNTILTKSKSSDC